jgi:RNA polymerase sigma-70 factor (ECF subfamily)
MRGDVATYPVSSMQNGQTDTVVPREQSVRIDPAQWVDEHGDYLFRFAMVRLRNDALAEDCVQETLLSALEALDSYGGKSTERTWLTGILKHKVIDYFRKHSREVPLDPSETDLSEFDPLFERDDEFKDHWNDYLSPRIWRRSPDEALQENEFFGVLQACMSKLPERVASVFALREMNELETEEICELLAVSQSNFWVMMHRARMALRRCIEINWFMKVK